MGPLIPDSKFMIHGTVIHGDGFGKRLGFPTANIDRRDYGRRKLHIKFGVWAGWVKIPNPKSQPPNFYKAGIVVGPVDRTGRPKLEAHLIGFKGNLYGKRLVFEFKKHIRPFQKYKNIQILRKQIFQDLQKIKKILS